jgi:hypothetical protein
MQFNAIKWRTKREFQIEWNKFLSIEWVRVFFSLLMASTVCSCGQAAESKAPPPQISGIIYTNYRVRKAPWSIHVVKVDRKSPLFELRSVHAESQAIGLSTLTEQIRTISKSGGKPVAGINGDFYQRDSLLAGDPRGLQICDGNILSSPGGATFWIDAVGEPHADNVSSQFQVIWADGSSTPFEINGTPRSSRAELYTDVFGDRIPDTESGSRLLVLEAEAPATLSPLHIGRSYSVRVREVRNSEDKIPAGGAILAIGPRLGSRVPKIGADAKAKLVTLCTPNLKGIKNAISGGPVLMRDGHRLRMPQGNSFEFSSMDERHPRTAIGWNADYYFLMEVDGRQRHLSAGMTLDELTDFMADLGCENLMNLDGGGSATLWYLGKVRNSPCDGHEREIANSLVVVRKDESETAKAPAAN